MIIQYKCTIGLISFLQKGSLYQNGPQQNSSKSKITLYDNKSNKYLIQLIILLNKFIFNRTTMNPKSTITILIYLILLLITTSSKCRYNLDQQYMPYHVDYEPFKIGTLTACKDYIEPDRLGCCNKYNDQATLKNFKQIDGIFGKQGGGCDICAINLKRFWCEYACSARQDQFMETATQYQPFPDPQKPGNIIYAQRVNVRVHTETACTIFNSCKRNPFVASVSAMGSPAGFLNFQGHNALNDGHQYVSMDFSNSLNDSLAFSNKLNDFPYEDLNNCDYKTSALEIHNFTFAENCDCNTCEQACNSNSGYAYAQSNILEGFNYPLVGGVYLFVFAITGSLTVIRSCRKKSKNY